MERAAGRSEEIASSAAYLQQPLHYGQGGDGADVLMAKDDDKDEQGGQAVMMTWEQPLMEAHANVICTGQGDVLNIGFGLGIVDEVLLCIASASAVRLSACLRISDRCGCAGHPTIATQISHHLRGPPRRPCQGTPPSVANLCNSNGC